MTQELSKLLPKKRYKRAIEEIANGQSLKKDIGICPYPPDAQQLVDWRHPEFPSDLCSTCNTLGAQAKDKNTGKLRCASKTCRIQQREIQREKAKTRPKRSRNEQEDINQKISHSVKKKVDSQTEEDRVILRERQRKGIQDFHNDPYRHAMWKLRHQIGCRSKRGQEVHKTTVYDKRGNPHIAWTRGWEYRTIWILEQAFGVKPLFEDLELTNDVFFYDSDLPLSMKESLKTPVVIFKNQRDYHCLDHHVKLKSEEQKRIFIMALAKIFDFDPSSLSDHFVNGEVDVAIETKSFRRAFNHRNDWFCDMMTNAIETITSSRNYVYLVVSWTEFSVSLYVVDPQSSELQLLGKAILFTGGGHTVDQTKKRHFTGYRLNNDKIETPMSFIINHLQIPTSCDRCIVSVFPNKVDVELKLKVK